MTACALDERCQAENFSKQHQPREEAVKIFAPFCPKLFPRKINKQDFKHNESGFQEGTRQLRLVFILLLQVYATRGPTSYHKNNFVRLLTILFSVCLQKLISCLAPKKLSLHSKVFWKTKVPLNDFCQNLFTPGTATFLHVAL